MGLVWRGKLLDLFENEQKIFDDVTKRVEEVREGGSFSFEEYESLVKEYGKLLKQLRKSIHFADRVSNGLFRHNLILDEKVHYDALTGIYNRRFMDDNLKRVIKSLSRSKGVLSVMMLDIDFFKKYNDTYGHSKGDVCLKAVAKALSETARADDCVIRYGGEEFVILLPNTDEAGVGITAERLLECIRALRIPHKNSDIAEYVTISIGATTVKVKLNHHYMNYIKRADEALYMSKNTGRNKYNHLKFIDKEGEDANEA
jgi:diguanylate cyclase (GGDEF)-like protein